MDAQQFLDEFGYVANAPGGIPNLKKLILDFAVTGKLTNQDIGDTEAQFSLSKLRLRREKILEEQSLNASRKHKDLVEPNGWFQLPKGWAWEFLGYLSAWPLKDGDWIESKDQDPSGDIRIIQLADIGVGEYKNRSSRFLTLEKSEKLGCYFLNKNDVLIARLPDPLGRACIFPGENQPCVTVVDVAVCRCDIEFVNPFYLVHCINSPFVLKTIASFATGTTRQRVATGILGTFVLPIPPIEEQTRIVAKVDELMALCDKLEAQQQTRRKLQNNLRQSTLQAVASATSPHELQTTWTRLADNFGRLFHAPEDVDDLRKVVLDLAVSGYLSNPEESDAPASALKAKILATKDRGIADGSFSRKKHVKPEELEETTLPAHWESIILDEAISTIDAGWSPACLPSARDDENKWGVLKTTSVQVLRFLPHEHKELPASLDPRPQYQIELGDILITRAGPKNRVGICCVVDSAPPKLMISDKLIRFHIVDNLINPRFVALCLSAGEPGRIVERLKSGMADSQMNISQDKLRSITIPLPPIEEQHRILTKIEAFMKVVDLYYEQFRKSERLASQVAASAVAALTGIATEQQEEPMKAPQTELMAPLRLGQTPDLKAQAPLATLLARHHGEMPAKDLWQRFGGEIDAFYAQLKTEVAHGWILEPEVAEMREKATETAGA